MPTIDGTIVPLLYWRFTDGMGAFEWGKEADGAFQIAQLIDATVQEAGAKGMTVVVQVALFVTEELFPPGTDGTAETPPSKETEP